MHCNITIYKLDDRTIGKGNETLYCEIRFHVMFYTNTHIHIHMRIYMHMYRTYTHIYSEGKLHHRSSKFKANGIVSQRVLKDCKNKKFHNKE